MEEVESEASITRRPPIGADSSELEEESSSVSSPRRESFGGGNVVGLPFMVLAKVNDEPKSNMAAGGGGGAPPPIHINKDAAPKPRTRNHPQSPNGGGGGGNSGAGTTMRRAFSGNTRSAPVTPADSLVDDDESSGEQPSFRPRFVRVAPKIGLPPAGGDGEGSLEGSSGQRSPRFGEQRARVSNRAQPRGHCSVCGKDAPVGERCVACSSEGDSSGAMPAKETPAVSPASPDENAPCVKCGAAMRLGQCPTCSKVESSAEGGEGDPVVRRAQVPKSSKLGKLLGDGGGRAGAGEGGDSLRPRGKKGALSDEDLPVQGNDLSKVSKFFGTHISEGTAAALQKSKATPEAALTPAAIPKGTKALPVELKHATRHRRASSAEEHRYVEHAEKEGGLSARNRGGTSGKGQSLSDGAVSPAGTDAACSGALAASNSVAMAATHAGNAEVTSGRLSITVFRPSGVKAGVKFYLEVLVDTQVVVKTPMLEKKKPEWFCNACADATLDSLLIVRLFSKSKEHPESVSFPLRSLPAGKETTLSLEFPSGERCQVFALALNFGIVSAVDASSEDAHVPLDAPSVLDAVVTALYDINFSEDVLKRPFFAQLSFCDLCMRSSRLDLVTERRCLTDVNLDATFRISSPVTERMQIQLFSGDSELLAVGTLNVRKLADSPAARANGRVGCFIELRDGSGCTRAFAQVRYSVSHPSQGILSAFGRPLQGVPLRLDCGDVVLFNFKSLSAQIISAATQSSWDHVGIVYEEDGKLFVLEALSGGVQGVDANARLLDAINQAGGAKIGIRRLLGIRTPEVQAQLWTFAIAMTGRSYKKNIGQLVGSRWGRNKADDLSSVFCSELVAAAFKHLDLLDESFVTSNVLPKDLASAEFQLRRGSLGPIVLYTPKKHSTLATPQLPKGAGKGTLRAKRDAGMTAFGEEHEHGAGDGVGNQDEDDSSGSL